MRHLQWSSCVAQIIDWMTKHQIEGCWGNTSPRQEETLIVEGFLSLLCEIMVSSFLQVALQFPQLVALPEQQRVE